MSFITIEDVIVSFWRCKGTTNSETCNDFLPDSAKKPLFFWRKSRNCVRTQPSTRTFLLFFRVCRHFLRITLTVCELLRKNRVTAWRHEQTQSLTPGKVQAVDSSVQRLDQKRQASNGLRGASTGVTSLLFLPSRRKYLNISAFSEKWRQTQKKISWAPQKQPPRLGFFKCCRILLCLSHFPPRAPYVHKNTSARNVWISYI